MSAIRELKRPEVAATSPARAVLARRIATRDEAAKRLEVLRGVDSFRITARAVGARDAAEQAVKDAVVHDADAAADALVAGSPPPPPKVPAARIALQEAEDALTRTREARAAVDAEIAELRGPADMRGYAVTTAVADVISAEPAVAVLVAEAEALQRRLLDRLLALGAIASATRRPGPWSDVDRAAERLRMAPAVWGLSQDAADNPTLAAWRTAIGALEVSSDAPMPS